MRWQIIVARLRFPLLLVGLAVLVVGDRAGIPGWLRLSLFLVTYYVALRVGTVRRDPVSVGPPVRGRWMALNSPATRVPSHGIQAYGQTYAIDLACDPTDGRRPSFGWWPPARRPGEFPGFGQPVFASTDGVVTRAHQRERDHWSRNSWLAIVYVLVEGVLRELTGPSRVLGNHVIVDVGDGVYAVYAHLARGSLRVRKGQRVTAGEHIADCGNSGNSTEPHLHFQLMDHRNVLVAAGLPMGFDGHQTGDRAGSGLPANQESVELSLD